MKIEIKHIQDFLKREIDACQKSKSLLFDYKLDNLLEAGDIYVGTARFLNSDLFIEIIDNRSKRPRSNFNYSIVQFKNKKAIYFNEIERLDHFSTNCKLFPVPGKINWFKVSCYDPLKIISNQELWVVPSEPFVEMYHELNRFISSINLSNQRILPNLSGKEIRLIPDLEESLIESFSKLPDCTLIIGPPGCGKSHTIAKIVSNAIKFRKRVLVCAFTNEALISLCGNEYFTTLLRSHKVKKYALTDREAQKVPGLLKPEKDLIPEGAVYLATLCKLSQIWKDLKDRVDLVIMDEASQTILPMFELVLHLGAKTVFVGDPMQLPPVIQHDYKSIYSNEITFGFDTLIKAGDFKASRYIMPKTYRLSERAALYTSLFYPVALIPNHSITYQNPLDKEIKGDGPILIRTEDEHLVSVKLIIDAIFQDRESKKISCCLLTNTARITQDLQNSFAAGYPNIFIDTVYRSQGHTFDYSIFYMPQCTLMDLDDKLFNVATSRARCYTFIIVGTSNGSTISSSKASKYLKRLEKENNYIIDISATSKILSSDKYEHQKLTATALKPLTYTLKKRNKNV